MWRLTLKHTQSVDEAFRMGKIEAEANTDNGRVAQECAVSHVDVIRRPRGLRRVQNGRYWPSAAS